MRKRLGGGGLGVGVVAQEPRGGYRFPSRGHGGRGGGPDCEGRGCRLIRACTVEAFSRSFVLSFCVCFCVFFGFRPTASACKHACLEGWCVFQLFVLGFQRARRRGQDRSCDDGVDRAASGRHVVACPGRKSNISSSSEQDGPKGGSKRDGSGKYSSSDCARVCTLPGGPRAMLTGVTITPPCASKSKKSCWVRPTRRGCLRCWRRHSLCLLVCVWCLF